MGPTEMVAIKYVTKWVEAHVGRTNIAKVVAQILCEKYYYWIWMSFRIGG
jgi:hypothetical protein